MRQDVLLILCDECGTRQFAPTRNWTTNAVRDARRARRKVLKQEETHYERCGPREVISCEDLHRMAGVDPYGAENTSLVRRGRGAMPTCPFEIHLLGDHKIPESWEEVRVDLLLPHWNRGCSILHRAVEYAPEDDHVWGGMGNRPIYRALCRACEEQEVIDGVTMRHALLHGFNHAAAEHAVGEVTMEGIACLACEEFDVVLSPVAEGLPAVVGTPERCECEEPAYWGQVYL